MNDTTQTLIRAVLKIGGGYLLAKGFASDSQVTEISAALISLFGIIWGIAHRSNGPAAATRLLGIAGVAAAVLLGAGAIGTGCKSTPQRIAYNTVAVPIVTVDKAMLAWGDYVATYHPGAATEAKVKAAYDKYRAAAALAVDASEAYTALASSTNSLPQQLVAAATSQAAQQALSDLLNLMRQLGVKV